MDLYDDFGASATGPGFDPPAPQQSPSSPRPAPRAVPVPIQPAHYVAPRAPTMARAKAGLGLMVAAAGAGAGAVLGGPGGAAVGLIGMGALRNLYRAQGLSSPDPQVKGDAARSLAICVVGFALAGYLGYKIWHSSKDDE